MFKNSPLRNRATNQTAQLVQDVHQHYDPVLTKKLLDIIGPFLVRIFRLKVTGLENLDSSRPGLLAINHNAGLWGILDVGAIYYMFYILASPTSGVLSGMTGADTFDLPVLGYLAPRIGLKMPTPESLGICLDKGEWVVLAPGAMTDMLRPIWQRNQVRFKKSIFVGERRVLRDNFWYLDAVLQRGVPIYPVAISGTHEMTPILLESPRLLRWTGLQRMRADEALPGFPVTLNHFVNIGLFSLTPFTNSVLAWVLFLFLNLYVDILFMYPLFPIQIKIHIGEALPVESYTDTMKLAQKQQLQKELNDQLVATINASLRRLDAERPWSYLLRRLKRSQNR